MSSSSESFTIRQEEEIEVLKAIYGDKEVVDLRNNDAWKIPRPPEFTLRVAQNHDSMGEINADDKVTIRVKMSADYPITVPSVLKIYEAKALSSDDIAHLEVDMMKLAQSLVGEVMITEIAQNVGAWLVGNSRKKGPRFGSFYEEMEAEKEKRERKKRDEKEVTAKLESIELESIREEVERKAEALEEDRLKEKMRGKREKEETAAAAGSPQEMGYVRRRAGSLTTSARIYQRTSSQSVSECSADGYDSGGGIKEPAFCQEEVRVNVRGEQVRFDKLAPVGRNVLGGTVYLGNLAGKVLAVSEWPFKTSRGKVKKLAPPSSPDADDIHDAASLLKQIGSVEQELRSIHKLEHPNVVRYLGLTYQQKQGRVNLFVLEEFVYGSNLSFHLSENIAVELDLLRHYVSGVLEALEFMHGHNFVHRDLRDTSVFVESTGRVRVADFSIDKRVRDLWVRSRQLEDKFPMAIGRGGKKMDIYRLGLLTLSLAVGEIVQDPAIPAKMYPPDFQDFLKRCLDKDERERWSATELLEHRWIKNRLERSPLKDQVNSEKRNQSDRPLSPDNDGEAEPAVPFVAVGSGQSRLGSEFSYISDIGKGGFGEVMKVKNNLDGQIYAIKRIHLDSKNKQMTKKLMREVKLLSRLNHENVVRYYTSWIELTIMEAMPEGTETSISMEDEEELESSFGFKSPLKPPKTPKKTPKKSLVDDLFLQQADELFNASVKKSKTSTAVRRQGSQKDWSFSFQTPGNAGLDDDGSESDDDDESSSEDDVFGTSFLPTESWGGDELDSDGSNDSDGDDDDELNCGGGHDDSYVQFESSNKGTTGNQSLMTPDVSVAASDKNHLSLSVESERPKVEIRRMYIQMEYCDRQTLRNAIDDGLYKDMQRLWRMFREIIEGLVHIHTQGMIHRDLKPVNIFIDSHDHVKIGDFGLATILGKQTAVENVFNESIDQAMESDMTGQIGTALYIAPEINAGTRTTYYTQKVDMYSLGVIFFEMCYNPLQTGMERIKVLTELRSYDILFPSDFDQALLMQHTQILQMLLDHDPSRRPNSQGLLQSDLLPPPLVEEAELREMVRHTLANDKSKAYHHLVDSCIGQSMSLSQDISFDMELSRVSTQKAMKKTLIGQEYVRRVAEQVFHRHGALCIQMSHLLPKGKQNVYDRDGSLVQVMTRSGAVVSLPYDLRVPFARFLARSQINNIKRYSISTVFREVKVFGIHPREQLECAFDIVTPTAGSHLADAEVLFVVDELLRELPKFEESGSYFIRLNHTLLLQGILTNCGIREELHQDIYNVIREGDKWSKNQRLSHLGDLGVSESSAISLFSTLEHEGSVGHIGSLLRHMIRRKTVASNDIKSGLNDLEAIINNATSLGIKCPIVVSPSLVYNPGHFSGMVCQLVRQKKRGNLEIMAAGGRYDHLINCFASNFSLGASAGGQQHTSKEVNQSAVGISLSMDRLVAAVSSSIESHFSAAEVVIYSESHLSKEKSDLVSKLWSSGMKCVVADHSLTLDEAQEYAQEYSAHVIVILRDGEASARVRILEKEQRFLEKKVPCSELVEHLHKSLRPQQESSFENSSGGGSGVSGGTGQPLSSGGLSRMESVKSASGDGRTVQVNYNYRYLDRAKYGASAKKRLESTMSTKITGSLALLAPGTLVEVMPLHLPKAVLKAIAGMLEFEDDASHSKSVLALQERHPRHRKDLGDISDEIRGLKNRGCSVFVLYSADVHFFTLLLAT